MRATEGQLQLVQLVVAESSPSAFGLLGLFDALSLTVAGVRGGAMLALFLSAVLIISIIIVPSPTAHTTMLGTAVAAVHLLAELTNGCGERERGYITMNDFKGADLMASGK